MEDTRFNDAVERIVGRDRTRNGIGTLSEKTLHAILKLYYEPDETKHEQKVDGYVADILSEDGIIEIQTAQFNKMRGKLNTFLPLYPVTIVYPIPRTKWLVWIDEESGEASNRRKSPRKGSPYLSFIELYRIKDFLLNPNLKFKIVMVDMEEHRLLNGWSQNKKKGSSRYDRIPKEIVEEISITDFTDYALLIPEGLPIEFTSKDFQKAASIPIGVAQTALNILAHVGAVRKIGKKGNTIIYTER